MKKKTTTCQCQNSKKENKSTINIGKILEECKKCEKTLSIKQITEIMHLSISSLYNNGRFLKEIEEALGEEKFNGFVGSLISTLLINMYTNA